MPVYVIHCQNCRHVFQGMVFAGSHLKFGFVQNVVVVMPSLIQSKNPSVIRLKIKMVLDVLVADDVWGFICCQPKRSRII